MSLRIENGTPINIPPPIAPVAPVAHGLEAVAEADGTLHSLGIRLVRQPLDRWCWAACSRMILRSLQQDVSMCEVANVLLGLDCCNDLHGCNQDAEVADILTIFEEFGVTAWRLENPVSFESVQAQIDEWEKPIEVQISWDPGGHVVVIEGWRRRNNVRYIRVKDPWYGSIEMRFSDLFNDYTADSGRWVGTWIGFRSI